MPLFAAKNNVTTISENYLNSLLSLQEFALIYTGSEIDSKTGAGVTENSLADYTYAARFTLTGVTEISRVELRLDRDGTGADVTVQIRSGLNPDGSNDGTVLKQVVVPKEFIPDPVGWWSVPIALTGLTAGNQYWLVVLKAGDATNKVDWVGEASADGGYPVYRRAGSSGAWTTGRPALHFRVYSGETGELKHGIYGQNGYTTVEYSGELVSKVYRYLPPSDGPAGGIRDVLTMTWSGEYLKRGDV